MISPLACLLLTFLLFFVVLSLLIVAIRFLVKHGIALSKNSIDMLPYHLDRWED
jgi:hypothetical protein